MTPRILSATSIDGTAVYNKADEKVGNIKDLMIDTQDGSIQYAVMSVGGFLGLGDKLFAVPIEALDFSSRDGQEAVLDVNKEKLENSPGFDKDNWPSTADNTFVTSVYNHYGLDYHTRYESVV